MSFSFRPQHVMRFLSVILAAALITACSSTPMDNTVAKVDSRIIANDYYQRIDETCEQHALGMDGSAQQSGQPALYMASAKAILHCVNNIQFPKGHPDADKALRLMALAVINLIKGGDIQDAKVALRKTQSKFPNQDLYFADYSSFFDTATALLQQQSLSAQQLAKLNISSDLRAEIERHQYWLSH